MLKGKVELSKSKIHYFNDMLCICVLAEVLIPEITTEEEGEPLSLQIECKISRFAYSGISIDFLKVPSARKKKMTLDFNSEYAKSNSKIAICSTKLFVFSKLMLSGYDISSLSFKVYSIFKSKVFKSNVYKAIVCSSKFCFSVFFSYGYIINGLTTQLILRVFSTESF